MNLVISGLGLIGKKHAQIIEKCDGINLIAIVDPIDDAKKIAQEKNIPWYSDLETLFQNHQPDGVILATPTSLHLRQGLLCVSRRCPILIEKPITVTVSEGETLVKAARESGVPILVGHHRRHNPIIQKTKEIISSGKIGEIRAVHTQCWFYKPDYYFEAGAWRKQKGGGPISINLIHDIDCLRYLCGEIVEVVARVQSSRRGFESEDTTAVLLVFENGALGTLSLSDSIVSPWSWEFTSGENHDFPSTGKSCYHIGGSDGSVSVPDLTRWYYHGERDWWKPIQIEELGNQSSKPMNPLIRQMEHFCEVIKGKEPLISGEEAIKNLQIVELIKNFYKD